MPSPRRHLPIAAALLLGATTVSATVAAAPAERAVLPTVSIGDATAYEGDGTISFPLTLDRPAERTRVVVLGVTLDGTARAGQDYRPRFVVAEFPRGQTATSVQVELVDDDVEEAAESLRVRLLLAVPARIGDHTGVGTVADDDGPLTVNVLHLNDSHSHLQPDAASLNLGTAGGAFTTTTGGFPQVTAKFDELAAQLDNVVKVHAGDAVTGTLFYTLFKGQAEADLMNTVCFDIFELGNHEFDDGDATLAAFLDRLNSDPDCATTTLAANVIPETGTPLAPTGPNDYLQPYVVKEFDGQQVGFIGLDIAQKTQVSSQPLPTTEFLDETETAQYYVDELAAQGIDNIVLVTHYQYENDLALVADVTGVDAVIGGDSHTLLGDFGLASLEAAGPYPTQTVNAAGEPVCVVQAWQYSWLVGELNLTFDDGRAASCGGTPHLLINEPFTRGGAALPEAELAEVRAIIEAAPQLDTIAPDPEAQAIVADYAVEVTELSEAVIGSAAEPLCLRRVPDRPRNDLICSGDVTSATGAVLSQNGGFIQQVVTDAFLARSFRADLALQNAGGVRVALAPGDISIGDAYTVLPFSNTLVELDLTGAEIAQVLEEAVANFLDTTPAGSDGAYPYGSAIRWDVDFSQTSGSRFSNIEVRDRASGEWLPLDPTATYVVVTNSFLATGGDGWFTFGRAFDEGRVTDTFINYAQGLIDYIEQDLGGGTLTVPAPEDFSTQSFIPRG